MSEKLEKVKKFFSRKQFKRTLNACTSLLRQRSLSDQEKRAVFELRGKTFLEIEKWQEALEDLLKVLEIDGKINEDFLVSLANAFEKCKKPACAAECYNLAAEKGRTRRKEWELLYNNLRQTDTSSEDRAVAEMFLRERQIKNNRSSIKRWTISAYINFSENNIRMELYKPRRISVQSYLHILRGHSSFTPILRGRGGGYFIAHAGKGCIIDPGYGFIQNFIDEGYGFGDIHAIVVSHAHDDHMSDLPAICSILNKAQLSSKVDLYLDETSYAALGKHYLLALEQINIKTLLKPGKRNIEIFRDKEKSLTMDVYMSKHKVPVLKLNHQNKPVGCNFKQAVGLGFKFEFPNERSQYVLYSSDTGWSAKIEAQYKKVKNEIGIDVALLHISSVKPCEAKWLFPKAKDKDFLYSQHLGLLGVIRFVDCVKPKTVLLGERGAELDDVWNDLAEIIADACQYEQKDVHATQIGTMAILDGNHVKVI